MRKVWGKRVGGGKRLKILEDNSNNQMATLSRVHFLSSPRKNKKKPTPQSNGPNQPKDLFTSHKNILSPHKSSFLQKNYSKRRLVPFAWTLDQNKSYIYLIYDEQAPYLYVISGFINTSSWV